MEKMSYFATIVDKNYVEVCLCDSVPDFVYAVQYDPTNNVEIYFSADVEWTPCLETQALDAITYTFAHNVSA